MFGLLLLVNLERDKAGGYAMELNHTAQLRLVDAALPLMPPGGTAVFVTSHLAHFHGQKSVYMHYEPVAASKHAGEQALRARSGELAQRGIRLLVVSGDVIEGTITPRLMERIEPGIIDRRRAQAGALPTIDDFARAIVDAAFDASLDNGATVYVGAVD